MQPDLKAVFFLDKNLISLFTCLVARNLIKMLNISMDNGETCLKKKKKKKTQLDEVSIHIKNVLFKALFLLKNIFDASSM